MSNYVGGYILVDLEGVDLSGDSPKAPEGTYARLIEAKGKPIILQNFIASAMPVATAYPIITLYLEDNDEIQFVLSTDGSFVIALSDDDSISFTE